MTSPVAITPRTTPLSLTLLGALWGLVTLVLAFPHRPRVWIDHVVMDGGASNTTETLAPQPLLWAALCISTAVSAAVAPVLAQRAPRTAWIASLTPLLPLAVGSSGFNLSLASMFSLIGVASVVIHRNRRLGWLIGGIALAIPAAFAFVPYSALWVTGNVIVSLSGVGFGGRLVAFTLYAVGIALALGTATALSLHAGRREERHALQVREAEVEARASLARDLHDVVAHRMSLVAVRAETAPYSLGDVSPQTGQVFSEVAVEARGALDEMRTVLGVLDRSVDSDRPQLAPQPQVCDVSQLVAEARRAGASVELSGEMPEMDAVVGATVFRVVQEALTNARRHAPGETATVQMEQLDGDVKVRVSNPSRAKDFEMGRGLAGMRQRVERCGGTFEVRLGRGEFIAEATWPLRRAQA